MRSSKERGCAEDDTDFQLQLQDCFQDGIESSREDIKNSGRWSGNNTFEYDAPAIPPASDEAEHRLQDEPSAGRNEGEKQPLKFYDPAKGKISLGTWCYDRKRKRRYFLHLQSLNRNGSQCSVHSTESMCHSRENAFMAAKLFASNGRIS